MRLVSYLPRSPSPQRHQPDNPSSQPVMTPHTPDVGCGTPSVHATQNVIEKQHGRANERGPAGLYGENTQKPRAEPVRGFTSPQKRTIRDKLTRLWHKLVAFDHRAGANFEYDSLAERLAKRDGKEYKLTIR